jgi:hypothetical protein
VEKFGKAIAKIVPISEDRINAKKEATDKLSSFFGVLPDFPEVKDARKFKRKAVSL